jgi:hypothetical protein
MSLEDILEETHFEKHSGVAISLECTVGGEDLAYRRTARTEQRFDVLKQRFRSLIEELTNKTLRNGDGDPTFEMIIESLGPRRWAT